MVPDGRPAADHSQGQGSRPVTDPFKLGARHLAGSTAVDKIHRDRSGARRTSAYLRIVTGFSGTAQVFQEFAARGRASCFLAGVRCVRDFGHSLQSVVATRLTDHLRLPSGAGIGADRTADAVQNGSCRGSPMISASSMLVGTSSRDRHHDGRLCLERRARSGA